MKLPKPLIIAALVAGSLFAGGAALLAQNATNPPPAGQPPAGPRGMGIGGPTPDQIATALKLDDAKKVRVKTILDAQMQKMRDLRQDTTLSQADRRTKVQAIRANTIAQMKAVLTPEQFDQWQKMNQPRQRRAAPAAAPKQ